MLLLNKKEIKRLAIYFFYDKDGVVDDYVTYMLEDLNKNITDLLVVCNGELTAEGRKKLEKCTSNILVRKNTGFDVWAYKEGIESYGWDQLSEFDEIILLNFTMYGPIYPFKEMFDEMDNRDIDFWGITKHHGFDFDPFGTIPYGYIPEHIQSSFIVVRSNMLNSNDFHNYWDDMGEVKSYGDAVGKHEAIFTKIFEEKGYTSDVYVQTDDLKEYTHYPLMIMPLELVKNRRCPVFKRKSFTNEYYEFLNCTTGEPTVELYEYIEKNLDYDVNLIWDNLLRIENMADIKNRMHLNYVLPKNYFVNQEITTKKIALMLHIYFDDLIEYCYEYAMSMPSFADVYVTTDTVEKKNRIEQVFKNLQCNKLKVILIENRGRDVGALLVGCKEYVNQYDLVCFAHDKKTQQFKPYTIGDSFSYKCFENVLGSKEFVCNIIETFEKNSRLGLLTPPPPNHSAFYGIHGTEWGDNYLNTVGLAHGLNMNININEQKEPIAPLGTMFWFRPEAMKILFDYDWTYESFPMEPNNNDGTILHAVERIYPFVAQYTGFYSAWLMNDKFAAIEITNLHFMIREMSMSMYNTIGHQMGFNTGNYNLLSQLSFRKILKQKMKNKMPKSLWKISKKIYQGLNGKKWIG